MKRISYPLILLIISCIPLISFLTPGLPISHDGQDHVVRIASFYTSLTEGIWVPRWAGNLNWGYGHPILMFLYPFSSYLASAFHFIGFSYVDATKAVFVAAYIASILSMYLWMSTAWGKRAGVIGALLYGFAPYRFVDMYVRMAIGEHMAFVFPPLICFFLYKLAIREKSIKYQVSSIKYGIGLSLSFAALILSHNAVSLMFLPVIGCYVLYLYFFEAKKSLLFIAHCLMSFMLGFGLSAFFWVPALLEGKFTLRDIVTAGEALKRFVPWTWFFYSPWNFGGSATLTKSLGIVQWIGVVASLVVMFTTKEKKLRSLFFVLCSLLFVSLFIMTSASESIWKQFIMLQNFQFPWRFLSLTTFIAATLGGISISILLNMIGQKNLRQDFDGELSRTAQGGTENRKQKAESRKQNCLLFTAHCPMSSAHCSPRSEHIRVGAGSLPNVLFFAFCLLLIFSTFPMWHPIDYQKKDESFYTGVYFGTTDTGESTPIWTTRFMEHTAPNPMEVISGEAVIEVTKRTTTIHQYHVLAKTRAELLENTLFFPGWKITVDGIGAGIQYQDGNHRGLMTFWIDEGEHDVKVEFKNTKLRSIASYISIGSIISILCIGVGALLWEKRR